MKKAISLFLTLVIMVSMSVPAFAVESSEEYYTIQVEYSDNTGHQELLDVMIQNGNVFVNAKMLAERLGYSFWENDESAVIFNKDTSNNLPFGITQFKYNSTQVSHMLFNNMIDTYEAPFASVKKDEGSWIPFEYSLLLFNSGMMIIDDAVLIDIPTKRIIDYFFDAAKNSTKYGFDWADDFGYTGTDIKALGGNSHLINVFNGVLGFDGTSWATLFQQFAGNMDAYDQKYGEDLAILLCTESDKELQATIDKVELLNDLLNVDGDLGKLLSFTSDMTDFQVGMLYQQCEAVLNGIKNGNSSAVDYSRSYQALENALDRQTWFSHTGEDILEVQKGVSTAAGRAFNFFDVGMKVAEVVGYMREFQNQDEFSLVALTHYLDTANDGLELPEKMKESMVDYSDTLSDNIGEYMTKRFTENVGQWIIDEIPMHEALGIQAAGALFAWDIASNTIPFISNGLSGADNFELALHSMVFQGDTFLNYLSKCNSAFADAGNITAENMYELSQYGYIYLKSCYVTREAALASLANKSNSIKEQIQPLIDYQNSINTEIAEIMVELKEADKTNDGLVFGFLPSDNEDYLDKYDNSQLIQWISQSKIRDTQSINLLDGYWENTIQSHKVYQFLEDGTVKEYNAEPVVPAVPENLFYSRTLQYQWDGKALIIDWGEGFKAALELVTKASPIEWDNGLSNQISKIPDDEEFFYETGWEYSGAPSDNALYLVKVDAAEAMQESNELYDNDILTVTGTLKEQNYEINSENYGVAYILELDVPIMKSLYSDMLGYSGENVEISEIQIQFSLTDEYIQDNLVGKHLTVRGTVMYGHTGHHLTTILLIDSSVLNL